MSSLTEDMLDRVIRNCRRRLRLCIGAYSGMCEAKFVSILSVKDSSLHSFLFHCPICDTIKVTAILRWVTFFLIRKKTALFGTFAVVEEDNVKKSGETEQRGGKEAREEKSGETEQRGGKEAREEKADSNQHILGLGKEIYREEIVRSFSSTIAFKKL